MLRKRPIRRRTQKKPDRSPTFLCARELHLRWNQIHASLLNTFAKLQKLGYSHVAHKNGSISIIVPGALRQKKEDHDWSALLIAAAMEI